jgi:hypothetical protein
MALPKAARNGLWSDHYLTIKVPTGHAPQFAIFGKVGY